MKITPAYGLQSKLQSGLQICGENFEGELEWMGTGKQWDNSDRLETLIRMGADKKMSAGYMARQYPDKFEQENLNAYYD